MLLENSISSWIQIAPYSIDGSILHSPLTPSPTLSPSNKYCDIFPLRFFQTTSPLEPALYSYIPEDVLSNFSFLHASSETKHYYNISYTLTGYLRRLANGTIETIFTPPPSFHSFSNRECESNERGDTEEGEWVKQSQRIEHIWFYRWDDFNVPDRRYDETIDHITSRAAEWIHLNQSIVVSCFSGRGRSGTLSTIIGSKVHNLKTVTEVVDLIVRMRRSRDGLVETPEQLNYILQLLHKYQNLSLVDGDFDKV